MPGHDGELAVQTHLHPKLWWVLITLEVDGRSFDMVLDTGSPLSSVSRGMYDELARAGAIDRLGRRGYVLRRASIEGRVIADLGVRVSRRVTQVGADGVLGLDFLGRFTDVHFHVPSLRLTLE